MRRIDADALKKTLGDWIIAHYTDTFTGDDAGLVFAHLINRTETIDKVEKEMEWISCTERLPEKSGRYLVTRGSNVCGSLWDKVDILNYSDLMGLKKEKIWWSGNVGKSDFEKFDDVIAWQPLPEPYKTGIRINFSKFSNFGLLDALREEFGFGDVKRSDCFGCEDETTEDNSTVPAHWIDQGHKIFKCSNCGNYLDFRGVNAGRGTANYCPNCGAKMWNILTRKPQNKNSQREKKK